MVSPVNKADTGNLQVFFHLLCTRSPESRRLLQPQPAHTATCLRLRLHLRVRPRLRLPPISFSKNAYLALEPGVHCTRACAPAVVLYCTLPVLRVKRLTDRPPCDSARQPPSPALPCHKHGTTPHRTATAETSPRDCPGSLQPYDRLRPRRRPHCRATPEVACFQSCSLLVLLGPAGPAVHTVHTVHRPRWPSCLPRSRCQQTPTRVMPYASLKLKEQL